MALAISPWENRNKWWNRRAEQNAGLSPKELRQSRISLEDAVRLSKPNNNGHALTGIVYLVLPDILLSSQTASHAMSPAERKMWDAHSVDEFNQWYNNAASIEAVVEKEQGIFGRALDHVGNGIHSGVNYIGKGLGKAVSLIPEPARNAVGAGLRYASNELVIAYAAATGIATKGLRRASNGLGKAVSWIPKPIRYAAAPALIALAAACTPIATPTVAKPTVTASATAVPSATPTPIILGTDYANRLIKTGYSSEVAQRIASLPSIPANISFSEELLLIGERAGYARDDFIKMTLPLLENGKLPDNKLVVIRDIDSDGKSNATEINEGTNILDNFNRLPANLESLAVLNDDLYAIVAGNNNLVYAFNVQNFRSLFKELREAPYADELMKRVTNADPKENASQVWNYKVRRDDQVLFSILGLLPTDAKGWQFRFDNGGYHLKSWNDFRKTGDINTLQIMPLDDAGINEWFVKREDAEFAMMQLWVPDGMIVYDISKWKRAAWQFADGHLGDYVNGKPSKETDDLAWQALRNNMDILTGKQKVNGLDQYANLRARVISALDKRTKSYPNSSGIPIFREFTDYENATLMWDRQQWFYDLDRRWGNFVGKEFQGDIEPVLNGWKYFEMGVKLPYGVAIIDGMRGKVSESDDTSFAPIYMKALGLTGYGLHGDNPGGFGEHQVLGWTTPHPIIGELEGKKIYLGQIVSLLSAIDGAQKDGIPYIRGPPNGIDIVWRNPNIKN